MRAVVMACDFIIIGRTREETIRLMDEVSFNTLADLGGAPWIAQNDDVIKEQMPAATISDEHGFIYKGHVTLSFHGPMVHSDGRPMHDGFTMQQRSAEDA